MEACIGIKECTCTGNPDKQFSDLYHEMAPQDNKNEQSLYFVLVILFCEQLLSLDPCWVARKWDQHDSATSSRRITGDPEGLPQGDRVSSVQVRCYHECGEEIVPLEMAYRLKKCLRPNRCASVPRIRSVFDVQIEHVGI